MADLKLLTERVVEKEKAAIRKSLEQAEIKAEDDLQAFEAEEVQSKQRKKEEIDKALKREYEIKRNTLSIQKRNDLLASKQNILNKVFADSKEQLDTLDSERFQEFVQSVLNRFASEGHLTLTLGEKSIGLIDNNWLVQSKPAHLNVELSEQTVSGKSGLVIDKEGIDYNFLFDSLVEDIKVDILPKISKELF